MRQNQELLKQAQGFYQVGLRAKIDVTKAEANLYDAEAGLIRAKNQVELARVTLMTALGLKTWPYQDVEDVLEVTPQPLPLAELKAQAMNQRPELLKNRYQQEGNQAGIQVARAGYFPTLNSTASYGWQGTPLSLHARATGTWGGGDLAPVRRFGHHLSSVRQAKANLRATRANAEVLQPGHHQGGGPALPGCQCRPGR